MPSTVLVGAQWGDEGKGKITDLIASEYDYVVRYQGGNNAGHTVIHGDKKLALHLMPSGVMYENAIPVIGNGVVVDPGVLVKEMAMLDAGFTDTFRNTHPDLAGAYSWWSYRFNARKNNAGWRIDYFLVSDALAPRIQAASIYNEVFGSDHCPVGLELDLA